MKGRREIRKKINEIRNKGRKERYTGSKGGEGKKENYKGKEIKEGSGEKGKILKERRRNKK